MGPYERKTSALPFEVKADTESGLPLIKGFGATYETNHRRHDWGGDIVDAKAATATVQEWKAGAYPVQFDWEHKAPFGGFDSLDADYRAEGKHGLWIEGRPDATTENTDRVVYVEKGRMGGLSIGYIPQEWDYSATKTPWGEKVRVLTKIKLAEVSVVRRPMNPFATIEEVAHEKSWARTIDGMWLPAEYVKRAQLPFDREYTRPTQVAVKQTTAAESQPELEYEPVEHKGRCLSSLLDRLVWARHRWDEPTHDALIESMASASGLTATGVQEVICGSADAPPTETLVAWAGVLGVNPQRLLGARDADDVTLDTQMGATEAADEEKSEDELGVTEADLEWIKSLHRRLDAPAAQQHGG